MKKIVALVLAMVMVLGLATTAFAAKGGHKYADASINYNWDFVVTLEDPEDAKDETFATYTIEAVAKKDMKGDVAVFWDAATLTDVDKGDKEDVEVNGQDEFVKVWSETLADVTIVDGKTITYYATADKYEDGFAGKAVKVTLPALPIDDADRKCNTLYADKSDAATFYFFEGQLWAASVGGEVLNVDGVVVEAVAGDMKADMLGWTYWEHDFQIEEGYLNHNNIAGDEDKWGVTKVYCDNCKATFKFVETTAPQVAVAVFGEDNYEFVYQGSATVAIELIAPAVPGVSAGTTAGGAADDTTVESPKTFDAGIAMYVGMSVMAAAGSAVVLKKKD